MQVDGSIGQAVMLLKSSTVLQISKNLRRLIEVPFNASVRDTLNTMHAHDVLAVAVAAPPGQWIGAGGSTIVEADKVTGTVRKHYIGLVSVLDILVHIVQDDTQLGATISTIIGHSVETLNLWTISPNTPVYDVIQPMSNGIHRVLVPFESDQDVVGVELEEASSGYHILTQTDLLQFILDHSKELKGLLNMSIRDIGALKRSVFAVPHTMPVKTAFKCMGEGRKLIGTFSASDLRGCTSDSMINSWSSISVMEWSQKVWVARHYGAGAAVGPETNASQLKAPVTCRSTTRLGDVIKLALDNRIHRVWIVSDDGLLMGIVALSDMLSVLHKFP